MILKFLEFKKLELLDKKEVEKITSKFPPYSDFNFVSMWSWDVKEELRISKLNNNLVVRFADYFVGNPFFYFLGSMYGMDNESVQPKTIQFGEHMTNDGSGADPKLFNNREVVSFAWSDLPIKLYMKTPFSCFNFSNPFKLSGVETNFIKRETRYPVGNLI